MSDVTIVSTTADVTVLSTEREVTFVQVGMQGPSGAATTAQAAGNLIAEATPKTTPVDADSLGLSDSESGGILRKLTWGAFKAAFNGIFARLAGVAGGQTLIGGTGAGENLALQSTSNAAKGKISLGPSVTVDDATGFLGVGTEAPTSPFTTYVGPTNELATLGSEILTGSGWTTTGWTGSFAGGFTHTTGNTSILSYPDLAANPNTTPNNLDGYRVNLTITGRTTGSITVTIADQPYSSIEESCVVGVRTSSVVSRPVKITPTTDFNGTVVIGLKPVTLSKALWSFVDSASKSDFDMRFGAFNTYQQFFGRNSGLLYHSSGTSKHNTSFGKQSLSLLLDGTYNVGVGGLSLFALGIGSNNSGLGGATFSALLGGSNNTAAGAKAGNLFKFANGITAFGSLSATAPGLLRGTDLTFFGKGSGSSASQVNLLTNATAIGANSYTTSDNQIVLGDANVTDVKTSGRYTSRRNTTQSQWEYDAANYANATVSSTGVCTLAAYGSSPAIALSGDIRLDKTVTSAGTTGAQTIHKTIGSVNFASAATSLVVTNNKVTTSSVIVATVGTNDPALKSVTAVAASGSFTLYANAAATAETRVNFYVFN